MKGDVINPEALGTASGECKRIQGQVLGIIGLGRVGTAVALRAKVFGFEVIFYDPYIPQGISTALGIKRIESFQQLLSASDCVTLHCTLNSANHYMMNETAFGFMKKGSFFINTACEKLVNQPALQKALLDKHLNGAALDTYNHQDSLKLIPSLILTPHSAWYSTTSLKEFREEAANEMRRGIDSDKFHSLHFSVNSHLIGSIRPGHSELFPINSTETQNGATHNSAFPLKKELFSTALSLPRNNLFGNSLLEKTPEPNTEHCEKRPRTLLN